MVNYYFDKNRGERVVLLTVRIPRVVGAVI
jgi:hypothetical protein